MAKITGRTLLRGLGAILLVNLTQCTTLQQLSQQIASNAPPASTPLLPCVDQNPVSFMTKSGAFTFQIQHGFPNPLTITDVTDPKNPVQLQQYNPPGSAGFNPGVSHQENYQVLNSAVATSTTIETDTLMIELSDTQPATEQTRQFAITETSANPNYKSQGPSKPLQISTLFYGPVADTTPVRFGGLPATNANDGSCPSSYVVPLPAASLWAISWVLGPLEPELAFEGWSQFADKDPFPSGSTYTSVHPFTTSPLPKSVFPTSVVVPGPTISLLVPTYTLDVLTGLSSNPVASYSVGPIDPDTNAVPYGEGCCTNNPGSTYFEAKLQIQTQATNGKEHWVDLSNARAGLVQGQVQRYPNTPGIADALELTARLPNVVNVLRLAVYTRDNTAGLFNIADVAQMLAAPPLYYTAYPGASGGLFGDSGQPGSTFPLEFPDPRTPADDTNVLSGAAHTWQLSPPFTVVVLPNGVAQLNVLPLAIVYAPPGACSSNNPCPLQNAAGTSSSTSTGPSKELFAFAQSFSTQLSFGQSVTSGIANVSASMTDGALNVSSPSGVSGGGVTIPLPQFTWSQQQSWDQTTTQNNSQTQGTSYQFAQLIGITSGWPAMDPELTPGDQTPYADEPFWYDLYILLAHPQFMFWDFGTPASSPMTQSQFLGAQSQYWVTDVKELYQCVQSNTNLSDPSDKTVVLTPPECTELLKLDPFYPDGNSTPIPQGATPPQSRFVPLPGSAYGELPNTDQNVSYDISTFTSTSKTAGTQSTQVYNGSLMSSAATSTSSGLGFLNKGGAMGTNGGSGTSTTGSGTSGSQTSSLQITYSGTSVQTMQQSTQLTGQLNEGTTEIAPNIFWDTIFGGILVQDPNSKKPQ